MGGQRSFSGYKGQDEHKPSWVHKVGGGSTGRHLYNTASNFSMEYEVVTDGHLMNYLRELAIIKGRKRLHFSKGLT